MAEYKLSYWPGMAGRGEFIRLLMAETNTPYEEVHKGKTMEQVESLGYGQTGRNFAFPNLQHGDLFISQTPVICKYLATKLDNGRLNPKTEEDQIAAEILNHGVVDVIKEGEVFWHPFDLNGTHSEQRERAKPFMKYYETNRLPKWLKYFERSLKENLEKNGGKLFFIGDDVTYVDLVIFYFLEGNIYIFPESFQKGDVENLVKFYESIKSRPNVKKWLESPEREKLDPLGPPSF